MTSFKPSDARNQLCEKCGNRLTSRPMRSFPIALQVVFSVSFIAFLLLLERLKTMPTLLWVWSALQLVLGGFLIQARRLAGKRILICIHCDAALR